MFAICVKIEVYVKRYEAEESVCLGFFYFAFV